MLTREKVRGLSTCKPRAMPCDDELLGCLLGILTTLGQPKPTDNNISDRDSLLAGGRRSGARRAIFDVFLRSSGCACLSAEALGAPKPTNRQTDSIRSPLISDPCRMQAPCPSEGSLTHVHLPPQEARQPRTYGCPLVC